MLHKSFLIRLLLCLIFISGFFFINPQTASACGVTIVDADGHKNSLPADFNDVIEVQPDTSTCFSANLHYTVAVFPAQTPTGGDSKLEDFYEPITLQQTVPTFTTLEGNTTGQGVGCIPGAYCQELQGSLNLDSDPLVTAGRLTVIRGRDYPHQNSWKIIVCEGSTAGTSIDNCTATSHSIVGSGTFQVGILPSKPVPPPADLPTIDVTNQQCVFRAGVDDVTVNVTKLNPKLVRFVRGVTYPYSWWWDGDLTSKPLEVIGQTAFTLTIPGSSTNTFNGVKRLCVDLTGQTRSKFVDNCVTFRFEKGDLKPGNHNCDPATRAPSTACDAALIAACKADTTLSPTGKSCENGVCVQKNTSQGIPCDGVTGIVTAIGCVHTDPGQLAKDFLAIVLGVGSGTTMLMTILGSFQMMTSQGNPQSLQTGRDRFTSGIIGLLFVIFSVLLLQIIGLDILNIPGFFK